MAKIENGNEKNTENLDGLGLLLLSVIASLGGAFVPRDGHASREGVPDGTDRN